MCLIIAGPANKIRNALLTTPDMLDDIFASNKDGVGAMFTTDDGALVVQKALPKDLREAVEFIHQLPPTDRDLALHFRMRTHGDIDLENCHPYPILDGQLHMMHNGVIRDIDDSSDKTKSDTWHYIDRVLRPQLQLAPALISVPGWQRVIREDIGSNNKFVLLNNAGELVILNRSTGIEHDGMWFSNTYAWSPEVLIPDYRSSFGWSGWDDEGHYHHWPTSRYTSTGSTGSTTTAFRPAIDADDLWAAVNGGDADEVYRLLDTYPMSTLRVLFDKDRFVCSVKLTELSQQDAKIVSMVENAEEAKLASYCRKSAGRCRKVAEVVAWYGFWYSKEALEKSREKQLPLESRDEVVPDFEVVDGQVLTTKSPEENPDEADLESWRADFQEWLDRQDAGLKGSERKQPAKWTAQTPALLEPPAQVAKVKSRTVMYRGYRVEVPLHLFENTQWKGLQDYLEKEAQRMHAAELEAHQEQQPQAAEAATELGVEHVTEQDDALNEMYSA